MARIGVVEEAAGMMDGEAVGVLTIGMGGAVRNIFAGMDTSVHLTTITVGTIIDRVATITITIVGAMIHRARIIDRRRTIVPAIVSIIRKRDVSVTSFGKFLAAIQTVLKR